MLSVSAQCQGLWLESHARVPDIPAAHVEFIQPDKPQQNTYIERYNCTDRYDWLAHYLSDSIEEVQDYATRWSWTYIPSAPTWPSAT